MSIFDIGLKRLTDLISKKPTIITDEEPCFDDKTVPEETDTVVKLGIEKVGAWVGFNAMKTQKDVDICMKSCKILGLKRLDIIVNDFSGNRLPTDFSTYEPKLVARLADAANAAGLDVHLMSWIMPHKKFIEQASSKLTILSEMCQAKSIQWDAEEPWTLAKSPMKYSDASKLIGDLFKGTVMGVNGIGYTPVAKFGPLAEVCDYLVPQCYSTSTSGADPATVVPSYVKRWKNQFGKKKMVVGLAAYRQKGIPKYTVESALRSAFAGAEAIEEIDEVIYWSLGQIRNEPAVSKVIKSLANR